MTDREIKTEIPDDFMSIDREPVPLAFCARPTSIPAEDIKKENDVVEQILELVDPIVVANPNETRQAMSIKSYGCDTESEYELSDEESDFEDVADVRTGAVDSDDEFDRLVKFSAKIIKKTHRTEYPGDDTKKHRKSKNTHKTANIREYDILPPLENLSIECKSHLLEFGHVSKVVDCQVVIVSTCNEVLDFDSYLFDEKGNAVGQIYDIFGQVKTPQYVIRFNSSDEAALLPLGMKVFYAPTEEEFTLTPFKGLNLAAANRDTILTLNRRLDHQAAIQNSKDHVPDVDSDIEFSDDEAEKAFRRHTHGPQSHSRHSFSGQRGGRKRDRRGGHKVQFASNPSPSKSHQNNKASSSPFDSVPHVKPDIVKSEAQPVKPPQSTDSNPYAEFGCYSGYKGRFGI